MACTTRASLVTTAFFACTIAPCAVWAQSVTTYHNDTLRTGWNPDETTLTAANVGGGTFALQATTALDSQVDSQPLVMANQVVGNQSARTVVYVVTGGDTLYAIDGVTGSILLSRNFGTPVPQSTLPGQCNNNGPTVGITSTPAIDTERGVMYLIAYTYENGQPVFRLHAVHLNTLQDAVPPVVVSASAQLSDGSTYNFNPATARQRAALLFSGNTIYAGFSSYCDQAANASRGWLLGWNKNRLAPLPHNTLADAVGPSQSGYFLNSIWMSGFGPSSVGVNQPVFVVTSNSDKNSYGAANRDESVLKLSSDLSAINSYFTDPNQPSDDDNDNDLGSGGALLAPNQPGRTPYLAVAAGKAGAMYLFNRDDGNTVTLLGTYGIGGCWCGPSYFTGSDGVGRIVTSGGSTAEVWRINTSKTAPASLTKQFATGISSGQDPGFFTSVSSNNTQAGTAVVWAVGRPTDVPGNMPLYAINPTSGKVVYTATAGTWVGGNSDADTVPTVAGGHVYVATYKELTIFGLGSPAKVANRAAALQSRHAAAQELQSFSLGAGEHAVWGTIRSVNQTEMVLADRHGALVRVYLSAARQAGNLAEPVVGQAAVAIGTPAADGLLVARNVEHAKPAPGLWPADQ